ncbi:MAG: transcriptional repressor LexA [Rectinemataceae bacterium]|nr:transcriptional repressor LexA [Rectinemataceae bacterium]
MKTLTDRQSEVLDFIASYIGKHSYPPTIRETAEQFSISVKGAYDHVKALEKKGYLRIGENRSRAIEILHRDKTDPSVTDLPLLGTVAAGRPILAEENFSGFVRVPSEMTRTGKSFALSVRGDSMKDAGIFNGDIAVIEQKQTAENGEIVVAMIDDAVTLKRFYRENNRIKLVAENPAYAPIYTQDVKILGRLKGIIRTY